MSNIQESVNKLVAYGLATGLIEKEDVIYTVNSLLIALGLDSADYVSADIEKLAGDVPSDEKELAAYLEAVLKDMDDFAAANGLIENDSVVYRDLFDTKLMGLMVERPSAIISKFRAKYEKDPVEATDYYYNLSKNSDYIRRYRIAKDMKWIAPTEYGDLDITINLSKPEKDPKAIAAARNAKQSGYPKCQLCWENEGYSGRVDHPARENHRIIPVTIQDSKWGFQYSPYVYYNEHCIVFNSQHIPMKIEHNTFCKLFDFVKQFPHYFVGSNADLPIVGGSILSHDHFQGGHYTFAMAKAPVERTFTVKGFEDVQSGIVKWPMSVIRLSGPDTERIIALADVILNKWRGYTDEAAFIFAETEEHLTTQLLLLPESAETTTSLIWYLETISQLMSIHLVYITHTLSSIISRKRTLVLLRSWDLQYFQQDLRLRWLTSKKQSLREQILQKTKFLRSMQIG